MQRALFLKTKHLGDSVVLTASISAMPENWTVDVMCFSESIDIFRMHPRVVHVYEISRMGPFWKKLFSRLKMLLLMKRRRYQLVVQFSNDWRGAWISRVLNAPRSIAGFYSSRPAFWHRSFRQTISRDAKNLHAAEFDVALLRALGLYSGNAAPPYKITPSESSRLRVANFLREHRMRTKAFIVVHASSRWRFKGLPTQTWRDLLQTLLEQGYAIVLSGSAGDVKDNQTLINGISGNLFLPHDFSIADTAALYEQARYLVSIDSMSIHLAAAVGLPVAAIFGPTNEQNWHPWQIEHVVIAQTDKFPCRPCGRDGCNGSKRSECLETIPVSAILSAIGDLESKIKSNPMLGATPEETPVL